MLSLCLAVFLCFSICEISGAAQVLTDGLQKVFQFIVSTRSVRLHQKGKRFKSNFANYVAIYIYIYLILKIVFCVFFSELLKGHPVSECF